MEPEGFDIRYLRSMDVSYLKEWLRDPQVLRRFPMSDEAEIERAVDNWMFFAKYRSGLTATLQHIPCGIATLFLLPYKKIRHQSSFKICVDPKHLRKGIGSALIKNIQHLAKDYFGLESIYTEVFEGNPLIPLLERFGFYRFATQADYVKTPGGYLGRVCLIADLGPKDGA